MTQNTAVFKKQHFILLRIAGQARNHRWKTTNYEMFLYKLYSLWECSSPVFYPYKKELDLTMYVLRMHAGKQATVI